MKCRWLVLTGLLLASGAPAHRLDEYLQAARVDLAADRIDLDLDLTPGVAVADRVFQLLDANGDGHISSAGARAYARRVLTEIPIELDQKAQKLEVLDIHLPAVNEWSGGLGIIRLAAGKRNLHLAPGTHVLTLTNHHLAAFSVYQVNALTPRNPALRIITQSRDENQQGYRLEFEIGAPKPAAKEKAPAGK